MGNKIRGTLQRLSRRAHTHLFCGIFNAQRNTLVSANIDLTNNSKTVSALANNILDMRGTKRARPPQQVNSLQKTCFTAGINAMNNIQARGRFDMGLGKIPDVFDIKGG